MGRGGGGDPSGGGRWRRVREGARFDVPASDLVAVEPGSGLAVLEAGTQPVGQAQWEAGSGRRRQELACPLAGAPPFAAARVLGRQAQGQGALLAQAAQAEVQRLRLVLAGGTPELRPPPATAPRAGRARRSWPPWRACRRGLLPLAPGARRLRDSSRAARCCWAGTIWPTAAARSARRSAATSRPACASCAPRPPGSGAGTWTARWPSRGAAGGQARPAGPVDPPPGHAPGNHPLLSMTAPPAHRQRAGRAGQRPARRAPAEAPGQALGARKPARPSCGCARSASMRTGTATGCSARPLRSSPQDPSTSAR